MPSVKDTLIAAKKSATAAIHKALQSNADKIGELKSEFNEIQKGIAERLQTIEDQRNDLEKGKILPELELVAQNTIRSLKDRISEKVVDAEKVLQKLEKLGAKEEAQTMREGIRTLAGFASNKSRSIGH